MIEPTFTESATRILDVAERLAQARGFNGFSYNDIAVQLGVTKASLHYHFPGKADLGRALVERYRLAFERELEGIRQGGLEAPARLRKYLDLYRAVVREGRICLCAMLAAEYGTLPQSVQAELRAFFDGNERWLAGVLQEGLEAGAFELGEPPLDRARIILGALEGAMLISRVQGDRGRFNAAADHLLASLEPHPPGA